MLRNAAEFPQSLKEGIPAVIDASVLGVGTCPGALLLVSWWPSAGAGDLLANLLMVSWWSSGDLLVVY